MMTTTPIDELTALQRLILGKLGFWKDTRTTYAAVDLAATLGRSTQKVTAALRGMPPGYVRYFAGEGKGHAGLWQITPAGRRAIV